MRLLIATLLVALSGVVGASGWEELPNTKIRSVCPPNKFNGYWADFMSHCNNVVAAWSGGVLDTKRNRLVMWGIGNETRHSKTFC